MMSGRKAKHGGASNPSNADLAGTAPRPPIGGSSRKGRHGGDQNPSNADLKTGVGGSGGPKPPKTTRVESIEASSGQEALNQESGTGAQIQTWRSLTPGGVPVTRCFIPSTKGVAANGEKDVPQQFRHFDAMQREYRHKGPLDERYLRSFDGKLTELVVQSTHEVCKHAERAWHRTSIRDVGPRVLRISSWPLKGVAPNEACSLWTWIVVCVRWIIACAALPPFLFFPNDDVAPIQNQGWYDPLQYRYWGYPKVPRNKGDRPRPTPHHVHTVPDNPSCYQQEELSTFQSHDPKVKLDEDEGSQHTIHHHHKERILRPRILCKLTSDPGSKSGVELVDASNTDYPYVFVAYTNEQFPAGVPADTDVLLAIGKTAAKAHNVEAFWVGSSCLATKTLEEDVYKINDVIRGASKLVIAIGNRTGAKTKLSYDELLREWGQRMWTFPEILLAPKGVLIDVYHRPNKGEDWQPANSYRKIEILQKIWDDAETAREIVDHFEGTLTLSTLEFVTLSLRYLSKGQTIQYLPGDIAYVLMGLLRRRPKVDPTDSTFQAFARLSLANDNNQLLERMICMLPKSDKNEWIVSSDAWDAEPWDISPECQIAGIGNGLEADQSADGVRNHGDTVLLDGCYAAHIHWDSFLPVASTRQFSWSRLLALIIIYLVRIGIIGLGFVIFLYCQIDDSGTRLVLRIVGAGFLGTGTVLLLLVPYLVRVYYGGKLLHTQASLVGFEGYLPLGKIEEKIFGRATGGMRWSPNGTTLSKPDLDDVGCWRGMDPILIAEVKRKIKGAASAKPHEPKIFTIVDTNIMVAYVFEAIRPPVAAILCGQEGGMQRAVMCSYDWTTQTFFRETILRMETTVLTKMTLMGRIQLGFVRKHDALDDSEDSDSDSEDEN